MDLPDVFIVEDDELLADALSTQVEMLGYRVAGTASTAEEAVRAVLETFPKIVLMDVNLGEGPNGLDAARSIRQACEVPFIFYTAYGNDRLKDEVTAMGKALLLQKPVREETLIEAIVESLAHRSSVFGRSHPAIPKRLGHYLIRSRRDPPRNNK
jgi:CheY-like chemotaxis protein